LKFDKHQILKTFFIGMRQDRLKIFMPVDNAARVLKQLGVKHDKQREMTYGGLFEARHKKQYAQILMNINPETFDKVIDLHITGELNACLYHNFKENQNVCFNIDGNDLNTILGYQDKKIKEGVIVWMIYLREILQGIGLPHICIKTGNGYHIWFRFSELIDNETLYRFHTMIDEAMSSYIATKDYFSGGKVFPMIFPEGNLLHIIRYYPLQSILDTQSLKMNLECNSIRLFGTKHCNTGKFTNHLAVDNEFFNEEESWKYWNYYQKYLSIPKSKLLEGMEKLKECKI